MPFIKAPETFEAAITHCHAAKAARGLAAACKRNKGAIWLDRTKHYESRARYHEARVRDMANAILEKQLAAEIFAMSLNAVGLTK